MGNSSSIPAKTGESACPVKDSKAQMSIDSDSACPISSFSSKNRKVYNVYNQVLDDTNNMPKKPLQEGNLDKNRVSSSIPKGGTDSSTWEYPSPQMFWNALVRKGKTEGASEEYMDDVIAVHNNMNETTWNQVMKWEGASNARPKISKLLRFLGRPDDISPKARIKMFFGHQAPFDRHDWYVDREDGTGEVRYVIDYYHDESKVGADKRPLHKQDRNSMKSIFVDVRPALDSVSALVDRCFRIPYLRVSSSPLVEGMNFIDFLPRKEALVAQKASDVAINAQWADIQRDCQGAKRDLASCATDDECSTAAVELQRCTATVVCPAIVKDFDTAMATLRQDGSSVSEERAELAYGKMNKCLEMFKIDSKSVLEKK